MDLKELETNAYFEISSEVEKQLMKFGQLNSFKILRQSEGYQNPGKVLVEYEKMEAAILAKFTLSVYFFLIQGMKFSGRSISTTFYNPQRFANGMYE